MKRAILFVVMMFVFIGVGLFIAGDVQVMSWLPESRALLLLFSGISAFWVAICPFLDLDK